MQELPRFQHANISKISIFNVSKTSRFQDARRLDFKFTRLQHSHVIRFRQLKKVQGFAVSKIVASFQAARFPISSTFRFFRLYEFKTLIILRLQQFQDLTIVKIQHFSHLWFNIETYPEPNLAMLQISKFLKSCNLRPF